MNYLPEWFPKQEEDRRQIRITLPKPWIATLDAIADLRSTTRLGLMRFYIEEGIKNDLVRIYEKMKLEERFQEQLKQGIENVPKLY